MAIRRGGVGPFLSRQMATRRAASVRRSANVAVVQQARERIGQLDKDAEGAQFGRLCAVLVGVCALMCGLKYARSRGDGG